MPLYPSANTYILPFTSPSANLGTAGGMMTHGSVIARAYGIPAVVGAHHATERLTTGQCVRVDGSAGRITVLGD